MSSRAAAWGIFATGLVVLFVLGVFVMFLAAQATTGCDQSFGPEMTHPGYCEVPALKSLVLFLPLLLGLLYVVGSVVGIIVLAKRRWVALIPAGLAVLVAVGLVVEVLLLD